METADSRAESTAAPMAVGTLVDHFKVVRLVGRGGMGGHPRPKLIIGLICPVLFPVPCSLFLVRFPVGMFFPATIVGC